MKKLVAISLVLVAIGGSSARAAEFYFDGSSADVSAGSQFEVALMMDTETEKINAVQGSVIFPENFLEVRRISDGNSAVNFWIERPKFDNELGKITFAGATPGGYSGKGKLFSVVFYAKAKGAAILTIKDALALLNDGRGTSAKLTIRDFRFAVVGLARGEAPKIIKELEEKIPPADFYPEISQDPNLFDGKYFLVFATQDKESGVDFYEVSEERGLFRWLWGPDNKNFVTADSPYLLNDQDLKSRIFVRAVDRAGNERIVTLGPANVSVAERVLTILITAIVILVLILGGWRLARKRR